MIWLIVGLHLAILVWLLFLGGAERLGDTHWTFLFLQADVTPREIRFYAWVSLLLFPVYAKLSPESLGNLSWFWL